MDNYDWQLPSHLVFRAPERKLKIILYFIPDDNGKSVQIGKCPFQTGLRAFREGEVVLINLSAEYLGLQKTIELALACHARVVSLILWDPENFQPIPSGGHWPKNYHAISLERAVVEFQAKNMDLIYMRNPQDEDGNRLIRLDFQNVCA